MADAARVLQEKSDELAALRAAQAASQAAALAVRQQKAGALKGVNQDLAELERQEDQILAESQALTGVITGSSGSGQGTGSLIYPVNGPITSPFGWRIHPILGYKKFHTGVDFGVGYGTPIRAADSGTVIYATWMGGYGNVIIVDHGDGLSTLYAHQSSLAVGHRRARHARADRRLRGLHGVQHRARTCTSRCGSTATPSTPWATSEPRGRGARRRRSFAAPLPTDYHLRLMRALRTIIVVLLVSLGFLGGYFAGWYLHGENTVRLSPTAQTSAREAGKLQQKIIEELQGRYYRPVNVNKLSTAGVNGMLKSLKDPYTVYLTPKEVQRLRGEGARLLLRHRRLAAEDQGRPRHHLGVRRVAGQGRGPRPRRHHPGGRRQVHQGRRPSRRASAASRARRAPPSSSPCSPRTRSSSPRRSRSCARPSRSPRRASGSSTTRAPRSATSSSTSSAGWRVATCARTWTS